MNTTIARPVDIALRVAAAGGGGYGVAWLVAGALAVVLPVPPAEGVLIGAFAGFVAHVGAVVWCFSAGDAVRAVTGLLAASAPFAVVLFV
ncbi:MAG: hypothetical protein AB7N54_03390 [Alphaproteobacteria bacterium]